MIRFIQDRYYLNMLLGALFVFSLVVCFYTIYSLPANLHLADGYQPAFLSAYVAMAFAFMLGAITLLSATAYKKEIVVFRDRVIDVASNEMQEEGNKTTISLDGVRAQLVTAKSKKDSYQNCLHAICKQLDAGQGAFYEAMETDGKRFVELRSGYALAMGESTLVRFEFGEGLIGQSALSKQTLYIDEVPQGYIKIISGLGSASPRYVLIVPVKDKEHLTGVLEIASFTPISEDQRKFVEEASHLLTEKLSTQA